MACRSNVVCDSKHIIVGLSDGSLYNISWKGEVILFKHVLIVSQINVKILDDISILFLLI